MQTLLSFWQRLQEANLFVELNLGFPCSSPFVKETLSAARAFPSSQFRELEVPTSDSTNADPVCILFM